ncbi:MAG: hypothetical protein JJU00_05760 [Opitutales bacterium]|nr:hypothetical protein [Opitutales bacterium]
MGPSAENFSGTEHRFCASVNPRLYAAPTPATGVGLAVAAAAAAVEIVADTADEARIFAARRIMASRLKGLDGVGVGGFRFVGVEHALEFRRILGDEPVLLEGVLRAKRRERPKISS